MPLKIYYPFKPYIITQNWGNPSDAYATQFNDPNFLRHNGIDANVGRTGDITYQTEFEVYCPVANFRVESVSYDPNGGGNQISLVSIDPVQMGDKLCFARIFLCHAKKVLVKENTLVQLGELLMIADNTGFSTGPHTHLGLYRINPDGTKIDTNQATGSCDAAPYFTERFAIDQAALALLIKNNLRYYQYMLGLSA